jgi:uncharacterized membrane protein AbrB (regulator of aidB expression)
MHAMAAFIEQSCHAEGSTCKGNLGLILLVLLAVLVLSIVLAWLRRRWIDRRR